MQLLISLCITQLSVKPLPTQTTRFPQYTQSAIPTQYLPAWLVFYTHFSVYLTVHSYSYLVFCLLCMSTIYKPSLPTLVYYVYLIWLSSGLVYYAQLPISSFAYLVCDTYFLLWLPIVDQSFTTCMPTCLLCAYQPNPGKSTKKGLDKEQVSCIFSFPLLQYIVT